MDLTGLRPGEKLYEELLAIEEKTLPTYNPKVKVAEVAWLDYREVLERVHWLLQLFPTLYECDLVKQIQAIVPEYKSSNERYSHASDNSESREMELYPD